MVTQKPYKVKVLIYLKRCIIKVMSSFLKRNQRLFLALTAFILFFCFGFHALGVKHSHPAFLGTGIEAVAHGEDKKWLALVAVLFIWAASLPDFFSSDLKIKLFLNFLRPKKLEVVFLKFANYIMCLLRVGLLEPSPI